METSHPMTKGYYITHNVTHTVESGSGSAVGSAASGIGDDATQFVTVMRPGSLNRFLLQGVLVGNTYTISVMPYNVLGNGTARNLTFSKLYSYVKVTLILSLYLQIAFISNLH